ncbi:PREDICTED: F-box protein PP2-B11-like [Fragaria vesca subsp. vesca]
MVACATGEVLDLQALPEGCIANIISFTTPRDACRLSSVSKIFRSAAECDTVWDKFLPTDIRTIISCSVSSSSVSWIKSKKELYLRLCDNPIILFDIMKSFSLDKGSGKKCYMISARALQILGSRTTHFWRWISLPDSRFGEVAELVDFLWLEITGKIATWILSPSTLYKAYLVFKLTEQAYGFRGQPVKVKVKKSYKLNPTTVGIEANEQFVVLDREKKRHYWQCILGMQAWQPREIDEAPYPKQRKDGWLEIELGEFCYERDEELLKMSCKENSCGAFKGGLIVQGIEIRPYFGERPDPRQNWRSSWARSWNKRAQSYSYWVLYSSSLTFLILVLQFAFLLPMWVCSTEDSTMHLTN